MPTGWNQQNVQAGVLGKQSLEAHLALADVKEEHHDPGMTPGM